MNRQEGLEAESIADKTAGNMLLELLLFLPLLLFLLFVVMDIALEFKQQSAMGSSLRGALITSERFRGDSSLLEGGQLSSGARVMLGEMASEALGNLARSQGKYLEDESFSLEFGLVRLSFDPESGELLSHALLEPREVRGEPQSAALFDASLSEFLSAEYQAKPSALAVVSANGEKLNYRSEALVVAAAVRAEALNFFAQMSSRLLAKERTLREFQLFPLRTQGEAQIEGN